MAENREVEQDVIVHTLSIDSAGESSKDNQKWPLFRFAGRVLSLFVQRPAPALTWLLALPWLFGFLFSSSMEALQLTRSDNFQWLREAIGALWDAPAVAVAMRVALNIDRGRKIDSRVFAGAIRGTPEIALILAICEAPSFVGRLFLQGGTENLLVAVGLDLISAFLILRASLAFPVAVDAPASFPSFPRIAESWRVTRGRVLPLGLLLGVPMAVLYSLGVGVAIALGAGIGNGIEASIAVADVWVFLALAVAYRSVRPPIERSTAAELKEGEETDGHGDDGDESQPKD